MFKVKCEICGKLISKCNIKKHIGSKNCLNPKKHLFNIQDWFIGDNIYECPICKERYTKFGIINHYYRKHTEQGIEFARDLGHKIGIFYKGHEAWNKGLTKNNNLILKNMGEKLRAKYLNGELHGSFKGKYHTEETKNKLSIVARNSNHRRLVRNCRYYIRKDGSQVLLDSSWEEKLAKLLDDKNINWIRPEPIKWIDKEGKSHNYFPDFYLPDYDLYLDPKNPQACKVQKEKLDILNEIYNNIIILHSEDEIDNFENIINVRMVK